MKTNRIFSLILITIFLISCQNKKEVDLDLKKTTEFQNSENDTLGGIWNLLKVDDTLFNISKLYGYETDKPTLKIEVYKNLISGFSGCNSYDGNVKIEKNKIILTEGIIATEIGCGDNFWENDYFQRLGDIQSYQLMGDTLKLQNSNNKSMIFLRRHLHKLELNRWELTKVNDTIFDIKKVNGVENESQPTIMFNFEKGRIGGWNGCNNFGMGIDFKGDYYTSGFYQSDSRGCYKGWLEKFNGILADNKSYQIEEGILTLTSSKGKTLTFKKVE